MRTVLALVLGVIGVVRVFPAGRSVRFFAFCFIASMAPCVAQSGDTLRFARSTLYVSGLGNGLLYSINWDHRWRLERTRQMSLSVGFSYLLGSAFGNDLPLMSIPIQWNWFRGRAHHREHGVGLTYCSNCYGSYSEQGDPLASQGVYVFIRPIGYRFQSYTGGFFFRLGVLAWARVLELNRRYVEASGYWETPPVFPWIGIDVGYTFRKRTKPL